MADTIYYSDGSIQISSEAITLPHRVYGMSDVRSAEIARVKSTRSFGEQSLSYYLMFLMIGAVNTSGTYPFLALGALLYWLWKILIKDYTYIYLVRLNGKFGKVNAVASLGENYIYNISNIINNALTGEQREQIDRSYKSDTFDSGISSDESSRADEVAYPPDSIAPPEREIILGGKAYKLISIQAANKEIVQADTIADLADAIAIAAGTVLFFVLVVMQIENFFLRLASVFVILAPWGLATYAVKNRRKGINVYLVRLVGASRNRIAFASLDQARVDGIINRINGKIPLAQEGRFSSSTIKVNEQGVVIGKKKYSLDQIGEAKVVLVRGERVWSKRMGWAFLAMALATGGLSFTFEGLYNPMASPDQVWGYYFAFFFLFVGVLLLVYSRDTNYVLMLEGTFGQIELLSAANSPYLQRIAGAVNTALYRHKHGWPAPMEAQET